MLPTPFSPQRRLGEKAFAARSFASVLSPEESRQWPLVRPDPLECGGLVHFAVLDDVTQLRRVMDVLERIRIEHHEISELACFDGAEVREEAELVCAFEGCNAQSVMRRERLRAPLTGHGPKLPMHAQALELSLSTEGDVAAGLVDFGSAFSDHREVILGWMDPRMTAELFVQYEMRNEPAQHRVVMRIARLPEVLLAERPAVGHEQRGRVVSPRLRKELHGIVLQLDRK